MSQFRWASRPASAGTSMPIALVRVPKGAKVYARILAPFRGLWTHYIRKRTVPCVLHGCPHDATQPARWKAYAPAEVHRVNPESGKHEWLPAVVEITERLAALEGREDLVGLVVEFSRIGKRPNGPLSYMVVEAAKQPKAPPKYAPFDVEPVLDRLFDLVGRHLEPVESEPEAPQVITRDGEIVAAQPATVSTAQLAKGGAA